MFPLFHIRRATRPFSSFSLLPSFSFLPHPFFGLGPPVPLLSRRHQGHPTVKAYPFFLYNYLRNILTKRGKKRIHLNDQPLPITSISTLISVDRRVQIGPTCRIRDCRAKKMKEKDRGPISFSDIDASPSIPRRSFGTGITQECRWSIVHGRRGEGKRKLKKKNSQTLTQTEPWSSTCGYQLPQTQAIAVRRTPELDKFIHHNWFFNVQRRI